jgi:hypothetical protein
LIVNIIKIMLTFVEKIKQDKQDKFTKEEKTLFDIYTELYSESTPSKSFEKLVKESILDGDMYRIDFMAYEISQEKAEKIVEKHLTNKKYSKLKKEQFRFSVYMGCAPKFKYNEKIN